MTDSPVAAAFVAAPDRWSRGGAAPRAIVIHMAEGGGTVSWLTRNDGNSSHYVVEYSGRVVQMVLESEAAGSMNPKATRTDNDAPYSYMGEFVRYGRTALDAAGISADPNRYAIAIEVEGFADNGPNNDQRDALRRLVADIRARRGPLHVLGHRDQQAYKPCPGHRIPWADYGGHGPAGKGETMAFYALREQPGSFSIKKGETVEAMQPGATGWETVKRYTPTADYHGRFDAIANRAAGDTYPTVLIRVTGGGLDGLYLSTAQVAEVPDPPVVPPGQAELDAAHKAGRAEMRDEAIAAITALTP